MPVKYLNFSKIKVCTFTLVNVQAFTCEGFILDKVLGFLVLA